MNCGMEMRFLSSAVAGERREIAIPPGVSRLALTVSSADPAFEIVRAGSRPLVLLRRPAGSSIRVNGLPAPALTLLRLRDEVRIGERAALHLTAWRSPRLGPAPEEQAGDKCPVCRSKLGKSRAYQCPCGHFLHLMGDEVPEADRLECARLASRCPACEEEIRLKAGYLYEPEA